MAEKKEKLPEYRTPKGVVKWANVMTPQTEIKAKGETKPVDPNYNIQLLFDPNDAAVLTMQALIVGLHEKAYAAAAKEAGKKKLIDTGLTNCFFDDMTKDGEPTGKIAFKFKHKAGGVRRDKTAWAFRPPVFDRVGTPIPLGTIVFGGSVAAVSFQVKHNAMDTGMFYTSLSLQATVVYVLKEAFSRDASSFGFELETEEAQTPFGEQQENAGGERGDQHTPVSTDF